MRNLPHDISIRYLLMGCHDEGDNSDDNCQMLCKKCNREKSAK